MACLNFTGGKAIAEVHLDDGSSDIIYVSDGKDYAYDNDSTNHEDDPVMVLGHDFFLGKKRGKKRLDVADLEELCQYIRDKEEPEDPDLKKLYDEAMEYFEKKKMYEFKSKYPLSQIPNPTGREVCYVAGVSGSGKSTYTANYVRTWKRMFPDGKVYMFSALDKDPAFTEDLEVVWVPITKDLLDKPLDSSYFKNNLIIFDDIDAIVDKKLRDECCRLRDNILLIGRHSNTYCVCTSHQIFDFLRTRQLLNEAHTITFFPECGNRKHVARLLKENCGYDDRQIKKVCALGSRWITVGQTYPTYILYEKGVFLPKAKIFEDEKKSHKKKEE